MTSAAPIGSWCRKELGHVHCGHVDGLYVDYRQHRGRMEIEAEMTAYMLNPGRGMGEDSAEPFSPGYIAGWSKGDPAVLTDAMTRATRAFNKIMDGPWPDRTDPKPQEAVMTRTTFIDEVQDPVTGEVHRIEAATEARLDAATERYFASSNAGSPRVRS